MKFYQRKAFWIIFLIAFSIILCRHFKINIWDNTDARGWYFGDSFSAKNVETAAHFYADSGFAKNAGLPYYGYKDTIPNNEYVYTHYPPMAEWISGTFATITGKWQSNYLEILPLLLSFLLFYVIYKFLEEIIENKHISFLSSSIIVLSTYFIAYADDIHQHLFNELFRWCFVFIWWRYLKYNTNKINLLLLAFLYLMMCLISFEPYVYIAIIVVGFSIVLKKKWISWEIAFLLAIPILAFAIRLYFNTQYFGSIESMIADMKGAFQKRIGTDASGSEIGHAMTWYDFIIRLPAERFKRIGYMYMFPTIATYLFAFLGMLQLKKINKQLFQLALVTYLASISWILVMPQHALVHYFTVRHIALFFGMTLGFGVFFYYQKVKESFVQKNIIWLSLHSIFIIYIIIHFSIATFYTLYIKFGCFYPFFGKTIH